MCGKQEVRIWYKNFDRLMQNKFVSSVTLSIHCVTSCQKKVKSRWIIKLTCSSNGGISFSLDEQGIRR